MSDVPLLALPAGTADWALLLLRIWIALLFGSSGWSHVAKPAARGESIGLSPAATAVLGTVELVGAALVALGLWVVPAAGALVLVMLGAIHRKVLVWKTGFWGKGGQGWYYDVLYALCLLIVAATGGGRFGL